MIYDNRSIVRDYMEYTESERLQVLKLIRNSRYFKLKDFTCKCKYCMTHAAADPKYYERATKIRLHAFQKLTNLRKEINSHIKINSAYRCALHHDEVDKDGATWQGHREGAAFDIKVTSHFSRAKTIVYGVRAGFIGVGIANTFVHLDARNWEAVYLYDGVE